MRESEVLRFNTERECLEMGRMSENLKLSLNPDSRLIFKNALNSLSNYVFISLPILEQKSLTINAYDLGVLFEAMCEQDIPQLNLMRIKREILNSLDAELAKASFSGLKESLKISARTIQGLATSSSSFAN